MPCAPIALFVYNRPDHTHKTVEALRKNTLASESDLFVFSDGSKSEESTLGVKVVRDYLKTISGFKSVTIIEREKNMGLAASIIAGVTEVVNRFGRIIVIEDDLVTSPYFLSYMNQGLELYEKEEKVASIHGYVYPVKTIMPETFFIRGADCWGWATWKRAWDIFEPDGRKLLEELTKRKLKKAFDFENSYPYTGMLESQIAGRNNSWAIRWYASVFLKDMLTLYPGTSLVHNIGFDDSGVHSKASHGKFFETNLSEKKLQMNKIPVVESNVGRCAFIAYFRHNRPPLSSRLNYSILSFMTRYLRPYLKKIPLLRKLVTKIRARRPLAPNSPLAKKIPWIAPEATSWLESYLQPSMSVFEWGSGGSTLFWAERVKQVISVEHNYEWFLKTGYRIKNLGLKNINYIHRQAEPGIHPGYESTDRNYTEKNFEKYCKAVDDYPDGFFDLIVIDGRARVACARHAVSKLKPGGYILFDNTDREEYARAFELLQDWKRIDFREKGSITSLFHKPITS